MIERLRDTLRRVAARSSRSCSSCRSAPSSCASRSTSRRRPAASTATCPLIVEPRWTSDSSQRLFVYHPQRRDMWFITEDRADIPSLAVAARARALDRRRGRGRHRGAACPTARTASSPSRSPPSRMSLLDLLPSRKKDNARGRVGAAPRSRAPRARRRRDRSARRRARSALGVPRSPYRERLAYLLGGAAPALASPWSARPAPARRC